MYEFDVKTDILLYALAGIILVAFSKSGYHFSLANSLMFVIVRFCLFRRINIFNHSEVNSTKITEQKHLSTDWYEEIGV